MIKPSMSEGNVSSQLILTSKYSHAVEVYEHGLRCIAPPRGGANKESGKHKRGKIAGWSKSSRRSMRSFLMCYRLPDSFIVFSVTLTIPGPVIPPDEALELFKKWRTYVKNQKWACVWRIEIQKRGQLHWHCIVGINSNLPPDSLSLLIASSFEDLLRKMPKIPYPIKDKYGQIIGTGMCNRMEWGGADEWATKIDYLKDQEGGWIRYLIDHTTKAKQEQIPTNIGRHWGKITAKSFVESIPSNATRLTSYQYSKFIRCVRRMYTPYIRCDTALFGRRRGYTSIKATQGKTDIFTKNNDTILRLINYALS